MGCSGPTGGLPISNIFKRNIPAMVCGTSEGLLPPAQNPIRASAGGARARQTGQLADRAHHFGNAAGRRSLRGIRYSLFHGTAQIGVPVSIAEPAASPLLGKDATWQAAIVAVRRRNGDRRGTA